MYKLLLVKRTILLTPVLVALCVAVKIRYISTEHPAVTYYNPKYVSYVNLTSQRYGRNDPLYYVGLHAYLIYEFHNNMSVHFYFYEFLSNTYRRGFVEMHFRFCDLIHKDKFFGSALKQGKLNRPCPYPAGAYNMYNMTVPLKEIPRAFPFTKGRIYCNFTATATDEVIGAGYIDMEIKEAHVRRKSK